MSVDRRQVHERFVALGVDAAPIDVRVRDELVIVRGGTEQWVFIATSDDGHRRLVRERAVLAALRGRVSFAVPEVVRVADDGSADLRNGVVGTILDADALFAGLEPARSRTLGRGIGRLVAELHRAVDPAELADVLPHRVSWPESTPWILERIPDVVDDAGLHHAIADALAVFDAYVPPAHDRVLVHSDVGLHNLALDPDTWAISGIFDFGEAAITDRHWDLRHLCWSQDRLATLDHAIETYGTATAMELDRGRVLLYNAATAFGYLAFRRGVGPETRWCGRTLAEDLAWTRWALGNVARTA